MSHRVKLLVEIEGADRLEGAVVREVVTSAAQYGSALAALDAGVFAGLHNQVTRMLDHGEEGAEAACADLEERYEIQLTVLSDDGK